MIELLQIATTGGLCSFLTQVGQEQPFLNSFLLFFSIVVPLAVAVSMAISGKLTENAVKLAALVGFVIPALISIWLTMVYTAAFPDGGYAFVLNVPLGLERFEISLFLGLNGISVPFYLLAGLVGLASGLYAIQRGYERLRLFLILLLVMQGGLLGVFSSIDVLFFYFFHEFALIPTFIMIAIWGRRGRKAVSLELTIYLTLGAMITLAGLLALYYLSGASAFNMIALREAIVEGPKQGIIFGFLLIGFGILVSLFPFHSWAPRGYATAPAPVAMLHAGVLKKFGLYGLIQLALPLLPEGMAAWAPLLLWLALGNIIIIGFVTIAQRDLKLMLGNASVMHMGYAFLGLYVYSTLGISATLLMMFAHGLSVALLFLLADCIEKRADSADFEDLGGLGQSAPVLMAFFVAATMASIGLPGFANFWGELGIFLSLWDSPQSWVIYPAVLGIIISAIYGLRAVSAIFFGEAKEGIYKGGDLTPTEKLPALILLIVLFIVGIWPKGLSDGMNAGVERLFEPAKQPINWTFAQPTLDEES